jgi:hypothetical protein
MCIFIFFADFVSNISQFKKNWVRYDISCILVFMYSARFYCQILMQLKFLNRVFIDTQRSNCLKILPVEAEFFHADRRMDMAELIVAFRNFANAANNAEKALKLARNPQVELRAFQRCSRWARSRNCEKDYWLRRVCPSVLKEQLGSH